jgi:hypothetical protein
VIATRVLVEARGPAELAHPDDERLVEQAARVEIEQQRRQRLSVMGKWSFSTIGYIRVLLKPCVSQPPDLVLWPPIVSEKYTVTKRTPASTNRRASRHPCP